MEKIFSKLYLYWISYTVTTNNFWNKSGIQLNDVTFSRKEVGEIQNFINAERLSKDEDEIPYMTTSIKADSDVTMGIVTDVKTELRKVIT